MGSSQPPQLLSGVSDQVLVESGTFHVFVGTGLGWDPLVFPAKNELFTVDGFRLVMRSEAEEHFATLPWRCGTEPLLHPTQWEMTQDGEMDVASDGEPVTAWVAPLASKGTERSIPLPGSGRYRVQVYSRGREEALRRRELIPQGDSVLLDLVGDVRMATERALAHPVTFVRSATHPTARATPITSGRIADRIAIRRLADH